MQHSPEQIKADRAAIDKGRCPETGIDLTTVDPENHLLHIFPHWQEAEHLNTDYGRRARLIRSWIDGRSKA
jgi:hypothetical protein